MPISFSILTNIVAFLPMALIPGAWGQIWAVIPAVVATALIISWVEAMLILPAHLGHVRPHPTTGPGARVHALQRKFADGFQFVTERGFGPLLATAMRLRYLTIALAVAILAVVVAIPLSGRMGFILMPEVESSVAEATAVLPVGAPDSRREQVRRTMVEAAEAVLAEHGGDRLGDGTYAQVESDEVEVRVYLTAPDVRPISTRAFTELWRDKVGELSGVEYVRYSSQGGPGGGPSVSVELNHPRCCHAGARGVRPCPADAGPGAGAGRRRRHRRRQAAAGRDPD